MNFTKKKKKFNATGFAAHVALLEVGIFAFQKCSGL